MRSTAVTQPSDQRSTALVYPPLVDWSTSLYFVSYVFVYKERFNTHGALYSNVPIIVDIRSSFVFTSLEHPKSVMTTLPPSARDVIRILSGLRSRCTISRP